MRPTQVVGGGCAGLLALLGIAALTGLLLPRTVDYVVTKEVTASTDELYTLFSTADGIIDWWEAVEELPAGSAWPAHTLRTMDGPTEGAGTKVAFSVGEEDIKFWSILATEEDAWVTYNVDFTVMNATRRLDLEMLGDGRTLVRLTETPDIGNPVMRWMARLPGEDLEQSFVFLLDAAEHAAMKRSQEAQSTALEASETVGGQPEENIEGNTPAQQTSP